ncbi:MAG: SRPBCC family protein, partial [Methanothrix sp.]|nr:SRPBCC family protein [Methanothrix sp.]
DGNESFDKLALYLESEKLNTPGKNVPKFDFPTDREIVITRIFDAPRELVFKASTNPDLIPQWWGPKKLTTVVERMDVSPGGAWRFIQRDQDGNEYVFHGLYQEIVPPDREVHTFEFVGMPGHVILETSTFEEFEGKTKLTVTDLFQTVEDRDGMFNSGMKEGATESMDRLEELLKKLK